jgi:uncharacterized membrane protein
MRDPRFQKIVVWVAVIGMVLTLAISLVGAIQ